MKLNIKAIKKFAFISGSIAVGTLPVGLIIALHDNGNNNSVNAVQFKHITGQGSSSVMPLINAITQETKYNVQYQANGSGEGLKSQTLDSPSTPFGMTSSLKKPADGVEKTNWTKNNIRTVTWAIDAIAITMNLPDDIQFNNVAPLIDIQELSKLYDKEGAATSTTWGDLLLNEDQATGAKTSLSATPIPLGRIGGKAASGTADGFWHVLGQNMASGSTSDENHTTLSSEQQTPEANSQALNILKSKEGSITYMSAGYALKNQSSNSKVAEIKAKDGSTWVPTIENVQKDLYKWRRPFNILYSTQNKESVDFTNFLLSSEVQNLISKNDFVPLTDEQKNNQLPLEKSDYELDNTLSGNKMGLNI